MCGIVGFMTGQQRKRALPSLVILDRMTDTLAHRGPDSRGVWYDAGAGIGLGHRRLAIRDLTPTGAQPMVSSCGRYVIVYNGEVYSQAEIARDLEGTGRRLRGHSDTEVILEGCAEWGVDNLVPRLIGMFAFALFDQQSREIVLVRDRLGIKPLYWGLDDGMLMFASELKPMRQVPGWSPQLDRDALVAFMRHNYIPAPRTIYRGMQKLQPGTWLRFGQDGIPVVRRFWDLRATAEAAVKLPREIDDTTAIDRLDALLRDAVRRRLVADVPIGALLSGGIDSSLVAALMAEEAGRRINTYAVGFAENGYDEAPYARAVARHIGTDHTELYASADHALALVEQLPRMYDEPFADASQLPTALVCALTRQHVTVALSGDGGDELFAGYSRYLRMLHLWRRIGAAPLPLRRIAAKGVHAIPETIIDAAAERLPARWRRSELGSRLRHVAASAAQDDPGELYRNMISHWPDPERLVLGGSEPKGILWDASLKQSIPDMLERMMLLDTLTYLPDDILTKVDRASMAVGLEARVPLLDHRVVEFAWSLPRHMKLRDGVTKWALREVLYRRVPRALLERPKMGFGVPLAGWLRGPLRAWAEGLLDQSRLEQQGVFDVMQVRRCWQSHLSGTNCEGALWNVLMVQAWLDANPEVAT